MFVKVSLQDDGPGPSEKVVSIKAVDNDQELVIVSGRVIQNGTIDVGNPLSIKDGKVLIELPRESASGRWRVWIPSSEVIEKSLVAAE